MPSPAFRRFFGQSTVYFPVIPCFFQKEFQQNMITWFILWYGVPRDQSGIEAADLFEREFGQAALMSAELQ